MKRIIIFSVICLMTILCFSSTISAAGLPEIMASDAEGSPGGDVDITISLKNNPGIVSMTLTVTYDDNVMTLSEVNDTGLFPGQMHTTKRKSPYTLTWENDTSRTDYTVNGTVVTLSFKISDTARSGDYPIVIGVPLDGIYNYDVDNVDFALINGNVRITSGSHVQTPIQPPEHVHSMIHYSGKEATCVSEGQLEHWFCIGCNRMFRDSTGTISINNTIVTVDPTNHVGRTSYKNKIAATATTDGYTGDLYCLDCGRTLSYGKIIPATGTASPNNPSGTQEWINPFIDIYEYDSYYNAVRYAYINGLFKGVSENQFAPNTTMTRGMFVTVLGRLAGVDTTYFYVVDSEFNDVVTGEWYAPYVEWASQSGIIMGYGDGRFGVHDTITIEQAAVIMYRYAAYIGLSQKTDIELIHYNDDEKVSDWATEAVKWVIQNKVYNTADYYIRPQNQAKRSAVAEIIYAFVIHQENIK